MVLGHGPGQVALEVRVVDEAPSVEPVGAHLHHPGGLQRRLDPRLTVVHHAVADGHHPQRDPQPTGPGRPGGRWAGAGDGGRRWGRRRPPPTIPAR